MFSYAKFGPKNVTANEDDSIKSDFKSLVSYLEKKFNAISDYYLDINGYLSCIYFQDSFMKDVFNFYPDRLCIDISFRCFETDTFMYLFLVEDSNGKNHVVSLGFTVTEDAESLLWLLSAFKRNNPNWRRTKTVALDSEIKQRDVIRNIFPGPCIVITLHHALKSFRKGIEIINELDSLPMEQIQISLELFRSMFLVQRMTDYEMYYQQFLSLHGSIVSYFQEVWLPMQNQWRTGLDFYHENVFSSLNSHLEYFDSTIKLISDTESSIFEFIKKIFLMLFLKRNEKVNIVLHTSPLLFSRFSLEHQISKILTPYAAKFVIDQFELSSEIHMDCSVVSDNYFFDNFGSPVNASASICSCHFFLYTFLPCRHIFAVRKILSLSILDENLIDYSWSMKYYQNNLLILQDSVYFENKLNSVPKNSLASHLLESTLPVLLNSSESVFNSQVEMLSQLVSFWKSNTDTYVHFIGVEHKLRCGKSYCPQSNNNESFSMTSEISNSISCEHIEKEGLISDPLVYDVIFKQNMWNFKSNILDGKYINYAYLCRIICETKESCLDWLRQMELIPSSVMCPSCNCVMVIKSVPRLSDGAVWVCSNLMASKRYCSRRSSVRQGSWFELTNMTFEQILTFCYMWINRFSQSQIISETGVSSATYISWNKLNRRVCEEVLLEEGKFSNQSNMDSTCSSEVLEVWLQSCGDEDTFVKFLQDANLMHRKDSLKRIMR
ncbi:SWIM-type domain-containing protein [Nephila pilipes]|uniref:SWIM-type domain-containing protein n=1 Tax=Nephila pilipes TaxID=299642 RepID=A0A8X6NY65_NEPPI|nr:SWIM-type domain-containing protein [Nephila pilipes]